MLCPKCNSDVVRRSPRRGFREGLLMRFTGRAPFKCHNCSARFIGLMSNYNRKPRRKHKSWASYLGIPRAERRRMRQRVVTIALSALFIVIAYYLILYLSAPAPPPQAAP